VRRAAARLEFCWLGILIAKIYSRRRLKFNSRALRIKISRFIKFTYRAPRSRVKFLGTRFTARGFEILIALGELAAG